MWQNIFTTPTRASGISYFKFYIENSLQNRAIIQKCLVSKVPIFLFLWIFIPILWFIEHGIMIIALLWTKSESRIRFNSEITSLCSCPKILKARSGSEILRARLEAKNGTFYQSFYFFRNILKKLTLNIPRGLKQDEMREISIFEKIQSIDNQEGSIFPECLLRCVLSTHLIFETLEKCECEFWKERARWGTWFRFKGSSQMVCYRCIYWCFREEQLEGIVFALAI